LINTRYAAATVRARPKDSPKTVPFAIDSSSLGVLDPTSLVPEEGLSLALGGWDWLGTGD